ncbi:MAG: hypothetical protein ACW98Y_06705, partial [Candidatus Thorarchaeota archaeon]
MSAKTVEIQYVTNNGSHSHHVSPGIRKIDLSRMNIESIDLTPLHKGLKLRELILVGNQLKEINLNPLCSLRSFETLNLRNNPLVHLDVTS